MSKLYSSRQIRNVLLKKGFIFISQSGSHAKFRNERLTVIVPMAKKEIPLGTFRSILRQASMTMVEFKKIVK